MIPEIPNTAYRCGQHSLVTPWFRQARPEVIPVPKNIYFVGSWSTVLGNGIASVAVKIVKLCVALEFLYVKN